MTFKIIQEINNKNQTVLTIIPSAFEKNGVYWFPPSNWSTKKLNSIIKNEYAKPDISFWEARPCSVKKSNIPTFALAEEYEEELVSKNVTEIDDDADADDDSEASFKFNQTTSKRKASTLARSPQADFNEMVETCLGSSSSDNIPNALEDSGGYNDVSVNDLEVTGVQRNIILQQQSPASNFVVASCVRQKSENGLGVAGGHGNIYLQQQPATSNYVISSCVSQASETATNESLYPDLLANQAKIIKEIEVIKEIVTTGIAKLLTQGDRRFEDENKNVYKEAAEDFEKILTEVQAKQFEENLMDTAFKSEMIRKTSFLIGKNGRRFGQGWTCCYELVDAIFVRHFLTKCSWTGGSKNCEQGKIPFFKYTNILNLFAEVTVDADPEFSLEKTKSFFKKILRNATRFENQEVLQTRKSSQRQRGPGMKLKKTNGEKSITSGANLGTSQEGSTTT